jgi:phytoene desaturase
VPFTHWTDMARIVPKMVKLQSYRSVHGLVSKYVKDERLRTALSFHPLLIGGNPFSVSSIYALISYLERHWGVHSAIGGTGAIVDGMVNLIEGQGSSVRSMPRSPRSPPADRRATGVRLKDGEVIPADVVVANSDFAWTQQNLLPASSAASGRLAAQGVALLQRPLRLVLRHQAPVPGRAASQHPARPALQGPAGRHLP